MAASSQSKDLYSGRGAQEKQRDQGEGQLPAGGLPIPQGVGDLLTCSQKGGCQTHGVGCAGAEASTSGQLRPHGDVQAGQGPKTQQEQGRQ